MRGKGHGLILYMPESFVLSLAELQFKMKLGRSWAGLLALTEGFHQLGVLSDEDYETYRARYTTSILEKNKKPPTLKQLRHKEELEELENYYSRALDQWATMKDSAKQYYLRKAEQDTKKAKNAKLLLDLATNGLEAQQ